MPQLFPNAVRYVSDQLFETFGYGELEDQNSGDDGVDIVVWKNFGDELNSQLIILAQCAIGTDWRKKRSELDLSVWEQHLRWATKPLKAFAVPFQHERGGTWQETAVRGGIVFDRARIVAQLPTTPLPNELRQRMQQWCEGRIEAFRKLAV